MDFELVKILGDFGLLILTWIVQLVVYPGFLFYNEIDLKKWHGPYTYRITFVVMPLMLIQLFVYSRSLFLNLSTYNGIMLGLVLITWIITFLLAIPLHNDLDRLSNTIDQRKKLISVHWMRTGVWTIIFIISLLNYAS
ncbi:MAG: hypothetical protein AAGK97_07190 [Bacteroidota bacterium]